MVVTDNNPQHTNLRFLFEIQDDHHNYTGKHKTSWYLVNLRSTKLKVWMVVDDSNV